MMRCHMVVRDELPVVFETRSSWSKSDQDRRSVEPSIDVGCSVMIIERRGCGHGSAYHVRFGEWCLAFVPDRSAGEIKANRNPHPRVHEAGKKIFDWHLARTCASWPLAVCSMSGAWRSRNPDLAVGARCTARQHLRSNRASSDIHRAKCCGRPADPERRKLESANGPRAREPNAQHERGDHDDAGHEHVAGATNYRGEHAGEPDRDGTAKQDPCIGDRGRKPLLAPAGQTERRPRQDGGEQSRQRRHHPADRQRVYGQSLGPPLVNQLPALARLPTISHRRSRPVTTFPLATEWGTPTLNPGQRHDPQLADEGGIHDRGRRLAVTCAGSGPLPATRALAGSAPATCA